MPSFCLNDLYISFNKRASMPNKKQIFEVIVRISKPKKNLEDVFKLKKKNKSKVKPK